MMSIFRFTANEPKSIFKVWLLNLAAPGIGIGCFYGIGPSAWKLLAVFWLLELVFLRLEVWIPCIVIMSVLGTWLVRKHNNELRYAHKRIKLGNRNTPNSSKSILKPKPAIEPAATPSTAASFIADSPTATPSTIATPTATAATPIGDFDVRALDSIPTPKLRTAEIADKELEEEINSEADTSQNDNASGTSSSLKGVFAGRARRQTAPTSQLGQRPPQPTLSNKATDLIQRLSSMDGKRFAAKDKASLTTGELLKETVITPALRQRLVRSNTNVKSTAYSPEKTAIHPFIPISETEDKERQEQEQHTPLERQEREQAPYAAPAKASAPTPMNSLPTPQASPSKDEPGVGGTEMLITASGSKYKAISTEDLHSDLLSPLTLPSSCLRPSSESAEPVDASDLCSHCSTPKNADFAFCLHCGSTF